MSRSQMWMLEWSFFLGSSGRRQYNPVCQSCAHDCKQSFRAELIACPRYRSKRSKNCKDKGGKSVN